MKKSIKSIFSVIGLALILGLFGFENCAGSSSHEDKGCANDSADAVCVSDEDDVNDEDEDTGGVDTGYMPYQGITFPGEDSFIKVIAPDSCDVVAIVKWDGDIVRDSYISAGDYDIIGVPNDNYQVFFYEGNGWETTKEMKGGHIGGFVDNERFLKANPVTVKDQVIQYDLKYLKNDKYQIVSCSRDECI